MPASPPDPRSRLRRRAARPPPLRLVRRAPRPLRLRRHLRARPPDRRRRRASGEDVHRPRPRARRHDHPLPGRQLRLRLPLGGRRRPGERAPDAPRPRLALDRDERGRPARVRALEREGRQRADARGQPRHPRRAGGARPARVHEHPLRRRRSREPAGGERARRRRSACGCGASATRWTARGSSATATPRTTASSRAAPRRRMRQLRPRPRARRLRQLELADADVRRVGAGRCSSTPTTTSTSSPATPTTSSTTATSAASSPRAVDMDRFIEVVAATADHVKAEKRSEKRSSDLVRRVERLVPAPLPERRHASRRSTNWPVAPRLLEDVYTVADAVVVGNLLISLLKHADRVTLGEPRAARERDRADHDRARRAGLAADDLLPVRDHLAPRAGRGAEAGARGAGLRDRRVRRGAGRRRGRHARPGERGRRGLPRQPVGRTRRSRSTSTSSGSAR